MAKPKLPWKRKHDARTREFVVRLVGTISFMQTVDVVCQSDEEAGALAKTAFQALLDDVEKPTSYDACECEVEVVDVVERHQEKEA